MDFNLPQVLLFPFTKSSPDDAILATRDHPRRHLLQTLLADLQSSLRGPAVNFFCRLIVVSHESVPVE